MANLQFSKLPNKYSINIHLLVQMIKSIYVLYTNIDQKLRNKLHRPMHYKIGVFNVVITRLSNPSISKFSRRCNEFMSV